MARPSQQEIIAKFVGFISERTLEAQKVPRTVDLDKRNMIAISLAVVVNSYSDGLSAALGEKAFCSIFWSEEVKEARRQFQDAYDTLYR